MKEYGIRRRELVPHFLASQPGKRHLRGHRDDLARRQPLAER
jgi:hypothetical protein